MIPCVGLNQRRITMQKNGFRKKTACKSGCFYLFCRYWILLVFNFEYLLRGVLVCNPPRRVPDLSDQGGKGRTHLGLNGFEFIIAHIAPMISHPASIFPCTYAQDYCGLHVTNRTGGPSSFVGPNSILLRLDIIGISALSRQWLISLATLSTSFFTCQT